MFLSLTLCCAPGILQELLRGDTFPVFHSAIYRTNLHIREVMMLTEPKQQSKTKHWWAYILSLNTKGLQITT